MSDFRKIFNIQGIKAFLSQMTVSFVMIQFSFSFAKESFRFFNFSTILAMLLETFFGVGKGVDTGYVSLDIQFDAQLRPLDAQDKSYLYLL